MDLINNITDITIGIRFNRSFKIKDILGAITDQLVYNEESPLNNYFENQKQDNGEMILINKNGSYLRLNTDDIILKHIVKNNNFIQETSFIKKYCKFILKTLTTNKINNINRIGIIFTHQIENNEKKFNKIIEDVTNQNISDAHDFSLSFSKKLATHQGQIKKGVQDYKNVIYSFKKSGNKSLTISLDYQNYFIPSFEDTADLKTDDFFVESEKYLKEDFYSNLSISSDEKKS